MQREEMEYSLSFKNWKDIPINKYDQDFTFIVDGKKYSTPRFVADLLSPKIKKLHYTDESVNEFQITTENKNTQEDHFTEFLDLIKHESKLIDHTNQSLYSTYFLQLCNIDEYIRLSPSFSSPVTTDNAIPRLVEIQKIYQNGGQSIDLADQNFESLISFISEHFSEFSKEALKKIPLSELDIILSRDKLKISDEDSLLDFVVERYRDDRRCSILFARVVFANVTDMSIEKFIDCFAIEDLDEATWSAICGRLLSGRQRDELSGRERYIAPPRKYREFKSESGHEFEGIMRYLTNKSGGNIHDNGTIEITSNEFYSHPKNLVDYQSSSYYQTYNDGCSFICFDFKDRRVQLSGYSIESYSQDRNGCHLRNWVMEVSNDGKSWEEVDRHNDDQTLRGSNITHNFKLTNERDGFYRFIKLRTTGYSWYKYPSNNYFTIFYLIEFFGKLDEQT